MRKHFETDFNDGVSYCIPKRATCLTITKSVTLMPGHFTEESKGYEADFTLVLSALGSRCAERWMFKVCRVIGYYGESNKISEESEMR